MKIAQLLSGLGIALTNEEQEFIKKHDRIKVESLDDREVWMVQNLLRKGIYELSNNTLIKCINEKS